MSENSDIQWTDASLNISTGCDRISPGCDNCYAMRMTRRLRRMGQAKYKNGEQFTVHPEVIEDLYKWKKPKKVFINSMSDWRHEKMPANVINQLFEAMCHNPQHTYLLLTKRHTWLETAFDAVKKWHTPGIPDNWWIGVTGENQLMADVRLTSLSMVPCNVKFVSVEPMLEYVDLRPHLKWLSWVIIGCETGPKRRKVSLVEVMRTIDDCNKAGVPVFVKQVEINGKIVKEPFKEYLRFPQTRDEKFQEKKRRVCAHDSCLDCTACALED